MSQATLIADRGTTKVSRNELRTIPVPEATRTFKPIPHYEIVEALVEALSFRHIGVIGLVLSVTSRLFRQMACGCSVPWTSKQHSTDAGSP